MATHTGRTALVTGANKGIGLEVARGLARAGVTLYVCSRSLQNGEAAAAAIRE